jgi:hypothetical protein
MATLRECFDVDLNRCLSVHSNWEMKNQNGEVLHTIIARISQDFDGNAKYWSFFIESGRDVLPLSMHYFQVLKSKIACYLLKATECMLKWGFLIIQKEVHLTL